MQQINIYKGNSWVGMLRMFGNKSELTWNNPKCDADYSSVVLDVTGHETQTIQWLNSLYRLTKLG